jgi:hypothetical protein
MCAAQVRLDPADVIVCEIHIDQGMKAQNPMDMVRFYQTSDPEGGDEPFVMPQQTVTSMLGTVYQGERRYVCRGGCHMLAGQGRVQTQREATSRL